jgi:organic radical activating enzyme
MRLLETQSSFWDMTLDNFRLAVRSLQGYPGIISVMGGNPAMHPKFEDICNIFVQEVPNKSQRGLWTNNVFKYAELVKETFSIFNLNPHKDAHGVKSLEPLKDMPRADDLSRVEWAKSILPRGVWYAPGSSSHSPVLTAVKDLYGEADMWDRISKCEFNQYWSASIIQNKGNLRAYFCEVAAAFDLARGTDHGIPVEPGWWRRNISEFDEQVAHFCPGCGIPAKLQGHMDFLETDTYTVSNADIAQQTKDKRRKFVELDTSQPVVSIKRKVIDYTRSTDPSLTQRIKGKIYSDFPIVRRPINALVRLGILK